MSYKPFIGLEIHVELKTKSKMFCGCPAEHFQVEPNTHTCPVCLGLPGALPVPNKKAIEWTALLGLALGCTVNEESHFDRKHYFYPDLPKGYQISQYENPLCYNGKFEIRNSKFEIGITRVHLEEDTGKLIHATVNAKKVSLVDFNRSGVPLVEIVTEPDFSDGQEAKTWVKGLTELIRSLGISDCDMEKGSMRIEANVSVARGPSPIARSRKQKTDSHEPQATRYELPGYKVEVKNLNSFRFLHEAIDYEIERQKGILEKGEIPIQETRGWSESKWATVSQRSKEEAQDYRYFPEPDIPPLRFTPAWIETIRKQLPELPGAKIARFVKDYKLQESTAKILASDSIVAAFFEAAVAAGETHHLEPQFLANVLVNKKVDVTMSPDAFIQGLTQKAASLVSESGQLATWVKEVLSANPQAVVDYKAGKMQVVGFLVGSVQKIAHGKADAKKVAELLESELKK